MTSAHPKMGMPMDDSMGATFGIYERGDDQVDDRTTSKGHYEYTFEFESGNQARPTDLNYVHPHHSQSNLNEFPGEGPDRAGKDPIRGHDHRHNGTASTREDRTRPRRELRWTPELPTTQRTDQIRDQEGHSGCHEGC